MKKIVLFLFMILSSCLLIYFIFINLLYSNHKQISNIINKTNNNDIIDENYTPNHIEWPLFYDDIPQINMEPIDYTSKKDYFVFYYNDVSDEKLKEYIDNFINSNYIIDYNSNNEDEKQYLIYNETTKIEIVWNYTPTQQMKVIVYRRK